MLRHYERSLQPGLVGLFRSRASLEAEILILRHQLNIQRRQSPKRLNFSTLDRLIFAGLYRLAPSVLRALAILKPETVIRWHRAGFRSALEIEASRRPADGAAGNTRADPRDEYRQSTLGSATNSWLLKLGIEIGQTSVASIGPGGEARHPRVGRRSSAIMPTASRRWICSSYRRSHFACSMAC